MERREREERAREALRDRLSGMALPRQRSAREEVIEILAEGMWTLICQGDYVQACDNREGVPMFLASSVIENALLAQKIWGALGNRSSVA